MTTVQEKDRGAAAVNLRRRLVGDTPRQLILLTTGLAVLAVLLGFVYAFALRSVSSSVAALQARTTEVSATGDLYHELNDLDAQAPNALLVGFQPADPSMVPASVDAAASVSAYEHDRSAADTDLERIAQNPHMAGGRRHRRPRARAAWPDRPAAGGR